jgi:hypothetical protein
MVDLDMVSETLISSPERLSPFGWVFVTAPSDGQTKRA